MRLGVLLRRVNNIASEKNICALDVELAMSYQLVEYTC